jgi:uncharacterized membrane protein
MNGTAAPPIALTIAYWLHMLATVAWIGGLATLAMFVIPAARKTLADTEFSKLMASLQKRISQVGWFSLAVLLVTGMFQMSSHPAYEGFMEFTNQWSVAILAKHAAIIFMVAASSYMTWGLLPAIERAALLRAAGKQVDEAEQASLQRRELRLLHLNLVLSLLVLALTAWARVAG